MQLLFLFLVALPFTHTIKRGPSDHSSQTMSEQETKDVDMADAPAAAEVRTDGGVVGL